MAIERHFYCDAPGCDGSWIERAPHVLTVVDSGNLNAQPTELHFCSWDCVLKYAGQFPAPERVETTAEYLKRHGKL